MASNNRLIIYFVPPEKRINGGIMSIFSMCKESRRFSDIHKADVRLCTYPCSPSYGKNDLFENDEEVFSFHELIKEYPRLESLTINIPEVAVQLSYNGFIEHEDYLASIPDLHFNILNQNIKVMPNESTVALLYRYTPNITQTTAHDRYATQEMCDKYGMPLHHLSVFIDSSRYDKVAYKDKSDIIAYSPDDHPMKQKVLKNIEDRLRGYKLVEIKDMSYSEFKSTIAKAKFAITFGEGFDGYFIEGIFSGSISFAVYNDDFFPAADFKKYANVYDDYESTLKGICGDIKALDDEKKYSQLNAKLRERLESIYSFKNYLNNLEAFYKKRYSFKPSYGAKEKFFFRALEQKDKLIGDKDGLLAKQVADTKKEAERAVAAELSAQNQANILNGIQNSTSWRLTRPLRYISALRHKGGDR